jgi:sporulation protein YlmC with PRC-barrel domain
MISKFMAAALIGTALIAVPASAQTAVNDRTDMSATSHKDGEWRSSKLIGVNVYNDANDKVAEIEDIIIDKSGKVINVILSVGGFLGIGEHYVAVGMDKLNFVNEPIKGSAMTTSSATAPANTPTIATTDKGAVTGEVNRSNRPMRSATEMWYPDHAVYNVTKDELKKITQFKYN